MGRLAGFACEQERVGIMEELVQDPSVGGLHRRDLVHASAKTEQSVVRSIVRRGAI